MSQPQVPEKFLLFNQELSKNLVIAIEFVGLSDIITNVPLYTQPKYGDPGLVYGLDGLTYGGLLPYSGPDGNSIARSYIDMNKSNLVLSQVLEQEQGRASISQMSFCFVDKDAYMTNLVSPGRVFPTILGVEVIVRIGFQQISYPEDYWRVFRGRVQGVKISGANVFIQLGDPNLRRRKNIFYTATTTLNETLDTSEQVIDVVANSDFHKQILGPDGAYDPDVKTYLKIDEEFIEYNGPAFLTNQFSNVPVGAVVTRGARGTTATTHALNAPVTCAIELGGNPLLIALRLMLSGWNGPYKTGVEVLNFVESGDVAVGSQSRGILLRGNLDAVLDLGASVGDYLTITGSSIVGNNKTVRIDNFISVNGNPNAMVICDDTFTVELDSAAVFSIRSQYDTFPETCGLKLYGWEVDVAAHQDVVAQFLGQEAMLFFIQAQENSGKEFIEKELYLPVGAYSLTRFGMLSVKVTNPPYSGETLAILSKDNVTNAPQVETEFGLSNRNFWNEIDLSLDYDDNGEALQTIKYLDADSLSNTGILAVLPIPSRGTRSNLSSIDILQGRATRLLNRYSLGALLIRCEVNMTIGATIEVGNVILLRDNGGLKIPNLSTGKRNITDALFEVKQVSIDFTRDKISLVLLSNQNFVIGDIFGTFAPSSKCLSVPALGMSQIRITPSYGEQFGIDEWRKWIDYVGTRIRVHNYDYSVDETVTMVAVSQSNTLTVVPALSFVPDSTHIIDLAEYSTSTDQQFEETVKLIHCFWDQTMDIVSGISNTQFTVSAPDAARLIVDREICVRDANWGNIAYVNIVDITGTTITVDDMGFTPSSAYKVDLVPWYDSRGPYRFL